MAQLGDGPGLGLTASAARSGLNAVLRAGWGGGLRPCGPVVAQCVLDVLLFGGMASGTLVEVVALVRAGWVHGLLERPVVTQRVHVVLHDRGVAQGALVLGVALFGTGGGDGPVGLPFMPQGGNVFPLLHTAERTHRNDPAGLLTGRLDGLSHTELVSAGLFGDDHGGWLLSGFGHPGGLDGLCCYGGIRERLNRRIG